MQELNPDTPLGGSPSLRLIDYAFNGLDMRKIGLEVLSINRMRSPYMKNLGSKKKAQRLANIFWEVQADDFKQ